MAAVADAGDGENNVFFKSRGLGFDVDWGMRLSRYGTVDAMVWVGRCPWNIDFFCSDSYDKKNYEHLDVNET